MGQDEYVPGSGALQITVTNSNLRDAARAPFLPSSAANARRPFRRPRLILTLRSVSLNFTAPLTPFPQPCFPASHLPRYPANICTGLPPVTPRRLIIYRGRAPRDKEVIRRARKKKNAPLLVTASPRSRMTEVAFRQQSVDPVTAEEESRGLGARRPGFYSCCRRGPLKQRVSNL